jgi:Mrp family chromosome partitioning ATPase
MKTMRWKVGTLPAGQPGGGGVGALTLGGLHPLGAAVRHADRATAAVERGERVAPEDLWRERAEGPRAELSQPGGAAPAVVVSLVHDTPPADSSELVFLSDADSPRAASYRILRQRLKDKGDPRVIVVTSAGRGEGKTTCAINLSMALAEHGRASVLLLEANIRRPRLAAALGFTPPSCLAEQLASRGKHTDAPWVVAACFSPQLNVLAMEPGAGGKWLLNGFALGAAIEQLRSEYDYVIVDAAATLGSADVNVIQDAADGVLFAARSGKTSGAELRRAAQQLAPADVLGVVLIDA